MTRWAESHDFSEGRDFPERLTAVADATERMLEALLSDAPLPGEEARPARFMAAMRYATLGGGKRLRPFLLVETARLFGAEGKGVLRAACALEMIHCYSLVHDDLPAMDDDDLRRGRPTTHKAYDEATAILVGDGLLTYAFDVTADPATHPAPAVRGGRVGQLARHGGLRGAPVPGPRRRPMQQPPDRDGQGRIKEILPCCRRPVPTTSSTTPTCSPASAAAHAASTGQVPASAT